MQATNEHCMRRDETAGLFVIRRKIGMLAFLENQNLKFQKLNRAYT